MGNVDIKLQAGLDVTVAYQNILKDIQAIQRRLNASGIKINIDGGLLDELVKQVNKAAVKKPMENLGNEMAQSLIQSFGVVDKDVQKQIKELSQKLADIRISELKTGDNKQNELTQTMIALSDAVVNNANVIKERMGIYDEFYDYLKKMGSFKISDSLKANLGDGWNELRQLFPQKFTIDSGIEIDSLYQELSSKFPTLFKGVADTAAQFYEICDAIKLYRADVAKIEPITDKLGLEDTVFENIIADLGKLDNAFRMNNADESAAEIRSEADAMDEVKDSALAAGVSKEKFADANERVQQTADETANAVRREAAAMMDMDDLDSILAGINMQGEQGQGIFQRFGATFRDAFSAYTAANLLERTLDEIVDAGKEAVETIKELDDAAVSLQMATGEDKSSVKAMLDDYNALGQELGAITTEVSESADEWLRQGHSVADTNTLIYDSMVLSKIANMESADSTEYLTSAMKGYKVAVGDVIGIVDKVSQVDLSAAVDAKSLMEAMSKTAVTAAEAGISMDKLLALTAASGEVTQQSAASLGTAFKGIFSRMQQIKANKLELIDDDGTVELLNDVELTLSNVGIDLRATMNEYNSFSDVLDDLAQKWDSLSSVQQAALAQAFGGTRHGNLFRTTMENYDNVLKYEQIAMDSGGKSAEKFQNYLDSLEAKTKSLQASLENLASVTISDELYADVLDTAKAMTDAAAETGILKSGLQALGTTGAIYVFQQLVGFARSATQELSNMSAAMDLINARNIGENELQRLIDLAGGLSQSQTRLLLSTNNLTDAQKIAVLMNQGMSQAEATATLQTYHLSAAQTAATGTTVTLGSALRGLWLSMAANPTGLITIALTAAFAAFNAYKQKVEEAKQAMQESKKEYESMTSELKSLNDELETTEERLSELDAIGYDGLSVAEKEEYDLLKATNEELEREYRIKEALAKVKAQEVAINARQVLSDESEVSIEKRNYGTTASGGRVFVDSVDSVNEYLNRAEQQKQALESAKKALEDYEATYTGTAEEMVQDKSWVKLNDNIKDAETAIQETEEIIAEKYGSIEEESAYLVDSFGNIVAGCENMHERIAELKDRVDSYFTPEAPEIPEPNVSSDEPAAAVSQTFNDGLFTKITAATEGLDKFTSAVETAQDAYTTLINGNYTSGELLSSIQSITSAVGEMGGKLNWKYFANTENGLEKLGDSIADLQQKYADSILNGAGIDVNSQFGQLMSNLIQNAMKAEVQLDAVNTQIDSMQQAYSDLTETIATYNDTGYITFDQLQTLLEMEPQYLACLVDENGQLQLNRDAMLALANERLNDAESQAVQQTITELGQLALIDEKTAVEDNAQAFTNAVDNLSGYNAELATTIAECTVGASAIRDLNAAITGAESQDGVSDDEIQTVLNNLNTKLKLIGQTREKMSGNLGEIMGVSSKDAANSAEDTAKSYVEKFKDELSVLEQLRDSGKLSEKDYLQQLRLLYERYFRDKKDYLDEYAEYENQYLQGMKSMYASAFSAATKTISKQIDAVEDQRDAAINAIKDEQEARQEAIEQQQDQLELQKKNLELQIKSIDKEIDAKNDEIDKIREAREEREREIDVQKKQYALAQQKNNRTDLIYNSEQGFVYRTNDTAIRDAQDEVDKAQEEIRIGLIEKEISVLEKRKESINDQIDLVDLQMEQLDEQMDKLNEYYDNLIEQTEKQFDAMIRALEETKSRWDELAELEEQAEMEAALRQFGLTTKDVLNMSDEAFQQFKLDYLGVLADIYAGNDQMLDSLSEVSGVDMSGLTGHLASTEEAMSKLKALDLTDIGTALQSLGDGFADVSDKATTAATNTDKTADSIDRLKTGTSGVSDNLTGVADELNKIPDGSNVESLSTALIRLSQALRYVSLYLGLSEGASYGKLADELERITQLQMPEEGLIEYFTQLGTAVNSVVTSLSGGAAGGESAGGEAESGSEGTNSLIDSLNKVKETADVVLGTGGESENESGGTGVIGQFEQLKTNVDAVSTAIGTGEEESSSKDTSNLISSIQNLDEKARETMGELGGDGLIGKMEQFKEPIGEAKEHVTGIADGLNEINGQKVECTIKVNIETTGGLPAGIASVTGTALNDMNLNSGEYTARTGHAHVEGTANVTGDWAVHQGGRSLVGELGQELIVRNGRFFTVGDNGAEMVDIQPGDIVFNHKQTEELLRRGKISGRGKAFVRGSAGDAFVKGGKIQDYSYLKSFDPKLYEIFSKKMYTQFEPSMKCIYNSIAEINKHFEGYSAVQNITNNSTAGVEIHATFNITASEPESVADEVTKALKREFQGMRLHANQKMYER